MAGAVTTWRLSVAWHNGPFILVLIASGLVGAAVGLVMEFAVFRPIQRRGRGEQEQALTAVIATVASSALLVAIAQKLTGGQAQALPDGLFHVSSHHIGSARISNIQIIIVVTAVVASALVGLFIQRSKQGRALRALALDRDMARMTGVNATMLSASTLAVAGFAAGIAGVLLSIQTNAVDSGMGEALLFKAFAVLIVAGVGSIRMTVVAAFALAILETAIQAYWVSTLRDVMVFAVIIVFLLIRPQGIASRGWQRV
jgi:branched-chain amino acid transport system permease protein